MILLLLDFVPSDTLWVSFTILELEDSDNGDNGNNGDNGDNGDWLCWLLESYFLEYK